MMVAPMFDFPTARSAARYRPAALCLAPTGLLGQGRHLVVYGFIFLKAPQSTYSPG